MERTTDWARLWQDLAAIHTRRYRGKRSEGNQDAWRSKARSFDAQVKRRWNRPDSSRDFIVAQLQASPDATALDIGAGTGAWAALLARHARRVTAVEPSPAMVEVLRENLSAEGIDNVTIVQGAWPDATVEKHDFSLCSHAMYGCPDLPSFVRSMEAATRRTCFLLIRAPTVDGLMARAAMHIWGQPHDSTNFQVAYNVLLQMGIYANVLMEDTGLWDPWTNASAGEALADMKRRFALEESDEHDQFLTDLLQQNLRYQDGRYVWPRGVRSALVYWDVD